MFRNQYDSDVTVWSPQGRLHQVEYAMEAVKQGSGTVGLKGKTGAVLVALKRAQNDLTQHQRKVVSVDEHVAVAMAGLLSDGRILARIIHVEALDHRYVFGKPVPVAKVVSVLEEKHHARTIGYGSRPFGVGLLLAAVDDKGPHVIQTCPSGTISEYKAAAIGARSQSARTYLQRHVKDFPDMEVADLVQHGLLALRETLPNDQDLTAKNTSVAVVDKGVPLKVYDKDDDPTLMRWIDGLAPRPAPGGAPAPDAAPAAPAAPMDQ